MSPRLEIGKASRAFKQGSAIGYAGQVVEVTCLHTRYLSTDLHPIEFATFEVLVADPQGVCWVQCSRQLNVGGLGATPVEGGKEANGALLYVARVKYEGGLHPAKCGEHLPAAHLAFHGTEVLVEVRILYV